MHRPETVTEATELLEELGDEAVIYAGGTELLLLLKLGFAEYPHLIDIKGIGELRGVRLDRDELRIGSTVTHRQLEREPLVLERHPALAAMERSVGNLRVRTMGSIGGNLCFADPHSDPATFLIAAGARVEARRGADDLRAIEIEELIAGPFENVLGPGELLSAIIVPTPAPDVALAHLKMSLHERPAITLACRLRRVGGELAEIRLAVGSAGIVARRAGDAERLLTGRPAAELSEATFAEAGSLAADAADPVEDANGSIEYKRHLVGVLTRRCVEQALSEVG
jgi:carbon-monoxide dehydrogenase medium subunit